MSYALQSAENKYDSVEFGNLVFLPISKIDVKNTNWETVKVIGFVRATGEMAQVLYPLFGKAANMDHETAPAKKAGNTAHPARQFVL